MASLARFEALLERIFERSTARALRARLTLVQLEHRVERTMELGRRPAAGRTLVPSTFRVSLRPRDLASVAAEADGAEELAGRLADAALAHARHHGYLLAGRPTVRIAADPTLGSGEVLVEALPPEAPADGVESRTDDGAAMPPAEATLAFRRPEPRSPAAILRIHEPRGRERVLRTDGSPLTIGRAPDNALVLEAADVSRHHARLQGRSGLLVLRDLGSTNGTIVNGVAIDEVVLGPGDRIQVGPVTIVVEPEEG